MQRHAHVGARTNAHRVSLGATTVLATVGFTLGAPVAYGQSTPPASAAAPPAPTGAEAPPAESSEPQSSPQADPTSAEPPTPEPTDDTAPPPPRWKFGFELAVRTGYGIPLGNLDAQTPLTDALTNMVPLWIDAGFRASPLFYGGLYFQYGFGSLNTDAGKPEAPCTNPALSCSTSDMRLGAEFDFHLRPFAAFDPWVGVGVDFEGQTFAVSGPGGSASVRASGPEMLLQVGGNWNAAPHFAVGYFVSFSLGQFTTLRESNGSSSADGDIADKALHEWLLLGVKATYISVP